jgi:phage shock protein A
MDPTSELSRFEDKIRKEEAKARGMEEVAGSSLEDQFDELEASTDSMEVESRLAALKRAS